jgi:hypothetical protein
VSVEGEGRKTEMGVREGFPPMVVCTGEISGNGIEERERSIYSRKCFKLGS